MIKRQFGKILQPVIVLLMLLTMGCAQQMKSVKTEAVPEALANAEIKSITVADDASRIEIISDKPIVYTYYMLETPPRLVVDIAQTSSGTLLLPIEVNKGNIKRIDVAKHEFGSGVLSRVDVLLADKVEVAAALDQQDRKRLILTIPVPSSPVPVPVVVPSPITPPAESLQVVDLQPVTGESKGAEFGAQGQTKADKGDSGTRDLAALRGEKTETGKGEPVAEATEHAASAMNVLVTAPAKNTLKPGERGLTAIMKSENSIQLEISGLVESFKVFRLGQPERLVIDIPKTRSVLPVKVVDVNAFNLGKARIGGSPDKLRIVFDATSTTIPAYTVTKSESGLLINFGEAKKKAVAGGGESETVTAPAYKEAETKTINTAATPKKAPVVVESIKETEQQSSIQAKPVAAIAAPVAVETPRAVASQPSAESKRVAMTPEASPATDAPAVDSATRPAPAPQPEVAIRDVARPAIKKSSVGVVDAVEFTQEDGVSRITVRTSGTCKAGQPVKTGKGFSLTLKDCLLPIKLQRQLDTHGFASAIKSIAPFSVKGKKPETRIAVNMRGTLPNSLKRDGDTLQWAFVETQKAAKQVKSTVAKAAASAGAPQSVALDKDMTDMKQEPAKNKADKAMEDAFLLEKATQPLTRQGKAYTGRKVTLEFSDADIRKIFQLLAEVSNQNFLISDDVSGTISLKLVNVPWDQALDVILENKGLGMQRDGNIVQIRPKTKMKSLDDEAIEMRISEEKKMPLSTVIFDINFATLSDIETQFKNLKSKRPDSSISSDTRTNKIIVVDIDPNIRKMRSLLESLDVPEKQVMIEARIVEASTSFARDIGVKWNFGYQDGSASVANINNITGSMGGVVTNVLPTGTTGGIAAGMSFGKLLSNIQLDMRLSAAATVGQVKIISTPKVLTVNNKAAKISQGQMIPYQNTSSTDGAKTEFIEAALSLEVTPHITADGSVNMKIKASNNTPGIGSPPPINKKEATTELVVRNGETTVIGGIYVDSETDGDTGVPYLSDIPLLGWLFKSNSKNKTKNELLIFITPKLMN